MTLAPLSTPISSLPFPNSLEESTKELTSVKVTARQGGKNVTCILAISGIGNLPHVVSIANPKIAHNKVKGLINFCIVP